MWGVGCGVWGIAAIALRARLSCNRQHLGLAKSLPTEAFKPVSLNLDKPKTVWVAIVDASTPRQLSLSKFSVNTERSRGVEARTGRQEHYKTFCIL
jgi:hypothetical protein